jgi:dolichol-phosphate mannosyltransferase
MTAKFVVIMPCYNVSGQVLSVIEHVGYEVNWIVAIDDACTLGSGAFLRKAGKDQRLMVEVHGQNQGSGSAVMMGYALAARRGRNPGGY